MADIRPLCDIANETSEANEEGDWTENAETFGTPRLFRIVASLAADRDVSPRARLFLVKAVLRLHRREVFLFEREAARQKEAAIQKEKEETAGDDEMEVEVVADISLEEVEREKLRRAREEGDYLDLTSSQVETITTPPEREGADERVGARRRLPCPPPR